MRVVVLGTGRLLKMRDHLAGDALVVAIDLLHARRVVEDELVHSRFHIVTDKIAERLGGRPWSVGSYAATDENRTPKRPGVTSYSCAKVVHPCIS